MIKQKSFSSAHDVSDLEPVVFLERILACPKCNAAFETKDELDGHALSHHEIFKFFDLAMGLVMYNSAVELEQINVFECMKCTRAFTERTDYELHKLTHLKESFNKEDQMKRHKCNYCDLCFAERDNLERHTLTHRPLPFICFCGLSYRFTNKLQDHLKLAHGVAFEEPTGLTNAVFDSLVNEWQTFLCENTKDSMQTALQTISLDKRGDNRSWYGQPKDDKVRCPNCTRTQWPNSNGFSQMRFELENRLKGLTDTSKCEDCGSQFVQSPTLKVYKCYLCPKAFLGYQSVENHEKTLHKNQQKENLSSVLGEISEEMEELL